VTLKTYVPILRSPMGWLWATRALSDIGDGIHLLAFNWLLVQQSGSAVAVVTASTLWLGGQVLAGWPGGRLADRWSPVRVLQGTYLAHAVVIGIFAVGVLGGQVPLWGFYGLAGLLGALATPIDPACRGLLMQLYPERDQLTAANGLFSTGTALAQTVGPLAGGLIFSTVPLGWAFAVNALSYLVAGLGLGLVPRIERVAVLDRPPAPKSDWRTQIKLAMGLGDVLLPTSLFAWLVAPLLTALLPYYVLSKTGTVLDLGLLQGGLWTGLGLGLLLGTGLVVRTDRPSPGALVALGATALGAAAFAGAWGWLAVLLLVLTGMLAGITYLFLNQVLLDRLDVENIAGVTGLLGSVLGLGLALGGFALGWGVQQGYYTLLLTGGAAVTVLVCVGSWSRRVKSPLQK